MAAERPYILERDIQDIEKSSNGWVEDRCQPGIVNINALRDDCQLPPPLDRGGHRRDHNYTIRVDDHTSPCKVPPLLIWTW